MNKHIPGDNLIIWEFDYAMTTFYEVDTEQISSLSVSYTHLTLPTTPYE